MRQMLDMLQLDHFVGEHAQGPALAARGRLTTGDRKQVGFLGTIKQPLAVARRGATMQGSIEAVLDEAFAHTGDGGQANIKGIVDRFVGPCRCAFSLVSFQENAGMGQSACGR